MGPEIAWPACLLGAALAAGLAALLVHRRLSETLAKARARYEALFSQRGVGIAVIAPDGSLVRVNRHLCEMVGYAEAELVGRRIAELTHPDERVASDEARRRLLEASPDAPTRIVERRYLHKDGRTVWALLSVAAVRDRAGAVQSLLGLVLDITALRRAQEELEWKNALIATQQDASLDAILLVDDHGRILSFNRKFVELWGLDPQDVHAGRDEPVLMSVVSQMQDPEGFLAEVRRLYGQKEERSHHELRLRDGRTIDRYSAPVTRPDGAYLGRVWYFRDVTERTRAETLLRESEERFRQMAQTIGDAFWMSAPDASSILYISPAFEAIWGRPCADLYADPGLWTRTIHPEDQSLVTRALESLADGIPYDIEFRIRRPDGTQRWVNDRGYPMRSRSGRVILTSGVASDISRRKDAEQAMRLSALAFESIADGVMVTDADRRIVSVNHAFTSITGYSEAEILGRNPRFLQSGRQDAAFYRAMWAAIERDGHWRGEVWDRRKDGEIFPELLSISAVRDAGGAVSHYVGVCTEISSLKQYEARLHHQAHHDELTGLPNRVLFQERFLETLARARRHARSAAVMLLDLDNFKTVNDSLGHAAGDLLLQEVARRLQSRIRQTDVLARFGGDEFAVLLDDVKDQAGVGLVARTLVEAMSPPFHVAGHQLAVTASIGVSCYPEDGSDPEALFKNADTAMYRAKSEGRNNYQFFAEEMNARAIELLTMGNGLRQALERGELLLHYQPQYELATGRPVGVEALVRWRHPELGFVPPARFIPVAEEMGLIDAVGDWVLRTACRQMKGWRDRELPLQRIAVNLSARQFRHPDLLQRIAGVLAHTGLPARCLELEVTESTVMERPKEAAGVLTRLKEMGVTIAVDDFGTGYSSLSSLKRLPLDVIKIDRSFVGGVAEDRDDAAIVRAIVAMAKSLKLRLVAEGVETVDQWEFLEREGCEQGQGYLFGRPVDAEALESFLLETPVQDRASRRREAR